MDTYMVMKCMQNPNTVLKGQNVGIYIQASVPFIR